MSTTGGVFWVVCTQIASIGTFREKYLFTRFEYNQLRTLSLVLSNVTENYWENVSFVDLSTIMRVRKTYILTIWVQSVEYLELNILRCHEYIMEQENYWENVCFGGLSTIVRELWVEYFQIDSMCCVQRFLHVSMSAFSPGGLFCWFEYNRLSTLSWVHSHGLNVMITCICFMCK